MIDGFNGCKWFPGQVLDTALSSCKRGWKPLNQVNESERKNGGLLVCFFANLSALHENLQGAHALWGRRGFASKAALEGGIPGPTLITWGWHKITEKIESVRFPRHEPNT